MVRTTLAFMLFALIFGTSSNMMAELSSNSVLFKFQELVITSNRVKFDFDKGMLYFEKDVRIVCEEAYLNADYVVVSLKGVMDDKNEIREIRAIGNVVIDNGIMIGKCWEATYTNDFEDTKIELWGPFGVSVQFANSSAITSWQIHRQNVGDASSALSGDNKLTLPQRSNTFQPAIPDAVIKGQEMTIWLKRQIIECIPSEIPLISFNQEKVTDKKTNENKQLPEMIPEGKYRSTTSTDEMTVSKQKVKIRRGATTWATLENIPSGKKLYDINDLAESHSMRLILQNENRVEFIREESPPYPELRFIFVRDQN